MIETWLPYFALTVAIELPVIAALVGRPRVVYERYAQRAGTTRDGENSSEPSHEAKASEKQRWPWKWDIRWRLHAVGFGFLVNLTTHPFVTVLWLYLLPRDMSRADELMYFFLIELGVVVAEGFLLWLALPLRLRHALLISLVANVPSAALSPTLWS